MLQWQWNRKNKVEYISLPLWEEAGVKTAFTARHGGVSQSPYQSLNLAYHVGDSSAAVGENRSRLTELLGCEVKDMVCGQQVHGSRIEVVDQRHAGRGARSYDSALRDCDALITSTPGVLLAAFYADCIPIFLFDPGQRVVAVVHSGWKGTMAAIAPAAVRVMSAAFGSKTKNIRAFIGPGIASCCFRVQADLAKKVQDEFGRFSGIIDNDEKGFTWNLKANNFMLLGEAGLDAGNIIDCGICTSCNTETFFSYRREQGITGRMAAAIVLQH